MIALSLVFVPVKALAFGDVGKWGLTEHEKVINRSTVETQNN